MKKIDVIKQLRPDIHQLFPQKTVVKAYAPTNIALCKYWGKRNIELNLPQTDSLSVALPDKGALLTLTPRTENDVIFLNGQLVNPDSRFATRLIRFLDLFRLPQSWYLHIDITMSIPVAAGLASSACGFAAMVIALNDLLNLQCDEQQLSILARLGSGSASRSLWQGFALWHRGVREDGMDSFAEPLNVPWPSLKIGLMIFSNEEKKLSSTEAMQRTVKTSVLYNNWQSQVKRDLAGLKKALLTRDFQLLGETAESNALAMHATMQSSWPPIVYHLPKTIEAMHKIWRLRDQGLSLYFTQDAGPNLKLLFEEKEESVINAHFPEVKMVNLSSNSLEV